MLVKVVAGLSLIIAVSVNPGNVGGPQPDDQLAATQLPERQKKAAIRPLVKSATECVARAVAADPRFGRMAVTDLIVDKFESCIDPVRTLIDAHDRYYGFGTGERFFMGPYLDGLPTAITDLIRNESR